MDKDQEFLKAYWNEYKKLILQGRDDSKIISFRDCIKDTIKSNGKLYFVGNGASASLCSHAATDFTKQAKIEAHAFNDHNLITALSNDYGPGPRASITFKGHVKCCQRVLICVNALFAPKVREISAFILIRVKSA